MLRVAGGASSVLVGVYIADLANRGLNIGAGLVGTLAAISFGAELLGAVPLGMLSDVVSTRALMTGGALLAGVAILLFGVTQDVSLFVVSRALEGLAAAAGVPALLAYLTDATADDSRLRARVMSYFELSWLVGLVGPGVGRGAAMGIYSFLLSVGAPIGSVAAGMAGRWLAIDGLTYATLVLAVVALALLRRLGPVPPLAPELHA